MRAVACLLITMIVTAEAWAEYGFFDSDGVRIRYFEQGEGEPIVLIHGSATGIYVWQESGVLEALARDFRAIALDLRGYGESEKPHDPSAYGRKTAEDVIRLLDHLSIERAHIVGYSMGASHTAWLVVNYPDRIASATLGASTYYVDTPELRQGLEASAARWESGQGLDPERFKRANPGVSDEDAREFVEKALTSNDPIALATLGRGRIDVTITEGALSVTEVPVLHIIGSRDTPANLEAAERLREVLPSVDSLIVDGATHAGSTGAYNRPEFVEAITSFVTSHSLER